MGKQLTANGVVNFGAKVVNLIEVDSRVSKLESIIAEMDSALDEAALQVPKLIKQVNQLNLKIEAISKTNAELVEKLKTLMKKG